MSDRAASAQRCLVAVCAHLAMMTVRNDNFPMWVAAIRDVLPDCDGCPAVMTPLRVAADGLANAARGRPQEEAQTRLRVEAERYFARAAAHQFESWKKANSGVGA